jgi:hypothetical protein
MKTIIVVAALIALIALNLDPTEQWPCSTAPDFCPNFHGDNG